MADDADSTPLVPPSPIIKPNSIDIESGSSDQIQCRICLESDGRDFIAPCKCKGTSKYVHRECLDHWRSVKEGFAFSHCTTCKAPYYLRVHALADRKWRTLKFRFFVTRDILFIFVAVQLVIASLAYLVYMVDGFQEFWLQHYWGFDNHISFYYICERAQTAISQALFVYGVTAVHAVELVSVVNVGAAWEDPVKVVPVQLVNVGAVWEVLGKLEYVVEDVDDEMHGSDWAPPPLPAEHIQQLNALGLLSATFFPTSNPSTDPQHDHWWVCRLPVTTGPTTTSGPKTDGYRRLRHFSKQRYEGSRSGEVVSKGGERVEVGAGGSGGGLVPEVVGLVVSRGDWGGIVVVVMMG
ncbi:hypothetical protein KSS87_003242 [Heliosperma pusillum]|nr:hypothetical protein KSS87_003242 [Heliosperma pusillum]